MPKILGDFLLGRKVPIIPTDVAVTEEEST